MRCPTTWSRDGHTATPMSSCASRNAFVSNFDPLVSCRPAESASSYHGHGRSGGCAPPDISENEKCRVPGTRPCCRPKDMNKSFYMFRRIDNKMPPIDNLCAIKMSPGSARSHRHRAPQPRQVPLSFPAGWGGRRKGAGRKPNQERPGVCHATRPVLARRFPVHVTLRVSPTSVTCAARGPLT
jgi:hypothetical protein